MSVPRLNSTKTIEIPAAEFERTRNTPAVPFIAASMGRLTRDSTSSGAIPCDSVKIVTVGAVRSGKTSTGARTATIPPYTRNTAAMTRTMRRFLTDQLIILFSISLDLVCMHPGICGPKFLQLELVSALSDDAFSVFDTGEYG